MSARRSTLILGIAAILSGCAQTAYQITAAPPSRDVRWQSVDAMQCDEGSQVDLMRKMLFCGVGAAICRDIADEDYQECMRDRGYQLRPIN